MSQSQTVFLNDESQSPNPSLAIKMQSPTTRLISGQVTCRAGTPKHGSWLNIAENELRNFDPRIASAQLRN